MNKSTKFLTLMFIIIILSVFMSVSAQETLNVNPKYVLPTTPTPTPLPTPTPTLIPTPTPTPIPTVTPTPTILPSPTPTLVPTPTIIPTPTPTLIPTPTTIPTPTPTLIPTPTTIPTPTITSTPTPIPTSLHGWDYNPNNGHYYIATGNYMTWPEAKIDAENKGGYLTTINDATENQWILDNFLNLYPSMWIGFNDELSEGSFVWANGEPATYTNWNAGEPNDAGGEDYTELNFSTGKWNDLPYSSTLIGIIERDTPPPTPSPTPVPTGMTYVIEDFERYADQDALDAEYISSDLMMSGTTDTYFISQTLTTGADAHYGQAINVVIDDTESDPFYGSTNHVLPNMFDLSDCEYVSFWGKSDSEDNGVLINFISAEDDHTPIYEGNGCSFIQKMLTTQWQQYFSSIDDLVINEFYNDDVGPFRPSLLAHIEIQPISELINDNPFKKKGVFASNEISVYVDDIEAIDVDPITTGSSLVIEDFERYVDQEDFENEYVNSDELYTPTDTTFVSETLTSGTEDAHYGQAAAIIFQDRLNLPLPPAKAIKGPLWLNGATNHVLPEMLDLNDYEYVSFWGKTDDFVSGVKLHFISAPFDHTPINEGNGDSFFEQKLTRKWKQYTSEIDDLIICQYYNENVGPFKPWALAHIKIEPFADIEEDKSIEVSDGQRVIYIDDIEAIDIDPPTETPIPEGRTSLVIEDFETYIDQEDLDDKYVTSDELNATTDTTFLFEKLTTGTAAHYSQGMSITIAKEISHPAKDSKDVPFMFRGSTARILPHMFNIKSCDYVSFWGKSSNNRDGLRINFISASDLEVPLQEGNGCSYIEKNLTTRWKQYGSPIENLALDLFYNDGVGPLKPSLLAQIEFVPVDNGIEFFGGKSLPKETKDFPGVFTIYVDDVVAIDVDPPTPTPIPGEVGSEFVLEDFESYADQEALDAAYINSDILTSPSDTYFIAQELTTGTLAHNGQALAVTVENTNIEEPTKAEISNPTYGATTRILPQLYNITLYESVKFWAKSSENEAGVHINLISAPDVTTPIEEGTGFSYFNQTLSTDWQEYSRDIDDLALNLWYNSDDGTPTGRLDPTRLVQLGIQPISRGIEGNVIVYVDDIALFNAPTPSPTPSPTPTPTPTPTVLPTPTPSPTVIPTPTPTPSPTIIPTPTPTPTPTVLPTPTPTVKPTPTPTQSPSPTPTPDEFILTSDNDFDECTTGGAHLYFSLPVYDIIGGHLILESTEFDSYGYWETPWDKLSYLPDCMYQAEYKIIGTVAQELAPRLRLRINTQSATVVGLYDIQSWLDGGESPSDNDYKLYSMFLNPMNQNPYQSFEDADDLFAAVEIVTFSTDDNTTASFYTDSITLRRFPIEGSVFDQELIPIMTFDTTEDFSTWTFGGAPEFYTLPIGTVGDGCLTLTADNNTSSTYGYWESSREVIEPTVRDSKAIPDLYKAVFTVSSTTPQDKCPILRLRLGTKSNKITSLVAINSNHDGINSPTPEGKQYEVYMNPPASDLQQLKNGEELVFAMDLINIGGVEDPQGNITLEKVELFEIYYPTNE